MRRARSGLGGDIPRGVAMARERDDSGSRGLPDELRGEERSLEALRARQLADSPGLETPGPSREMADGILTETCIECGKEYIFEDLPPPPEDILDRKSTRLNSSHVAISYAVFCLKKKKYKRYKPYSAININRC